MLRLHPARLPRLLRSLAMTNLGGLSHPEGRSDKLGSPLQGPLGSRRNFFSFPLARSMV